MLITQKLLWVEEDALCNVLAAENMKVTANFWVFREGLRFNIENCYLLFLVLLCYLTSRADSVIGGKTWQKTIASLIPLR